MASKLPNYEQAKLQKKEKLNRGREAPPWMRRGAGSIYDSPEERRSAAAEAADRGREEA
eukprot:CAMPEP_0168695752 /NCGR_PEP_ID=MMETSP0503-20121227/34985_1 /TAXON_ID=89963 /ORGANISM="Heterocapsa rotundata, Strain SCCAP K-0483" /LENGTH=58 /DNA_ID=CAMNT_0008741465 /DNA_START=57 /DNA_END=229 /DNA_ORIENTATION=-